MEIYLDVSSYSGGSHWFEFSFFLPLQGALSDSEEESASADLKDLEFKLLHDLTQLQVRRRVRSVLGRQV